MKLVRRVLSCATSCRSTRGNAVPLSSLYRRVPVDSENSVTQALPKTPVGSRSETVSPPTRSEVSGLHRCTPNRRRSVGHLHSSRSARHAITWYRSRAALRRSVTADDRVMERAI